MARRIERARPLVLLGRDRIPINSRRRNGAVAHLDRHLGRHSRRSARLGGHCGLAVIDCLLNALDNDLGLNSETGVSAVTVSVEAACKQRARHRRDLTRLSGINRGTNVIPLNLGIMSFAVTRGNRDIPRQLGENTAGRINALRNGNGDDGTDVNSDCRLGTTLELALHLKRTVLGISVFGDTVPCDLFALGLRRHIVVVSNLKVFRQHRLGAGDGPYGSALNRGCLTRDLNGGSNRNVDSLHAVPCIKANCCSAAYHAALGPIEALRVPLGLGVFVRIVRMFCRIGADKFDIAGKHGGAVAALEHCNGLWLSLPVISHDDVHFHGDIRSGDRSGNRAVLLGAPIVGIPVDAETVKSRSILQYAGHVEVVQIDFLTGVNNAPVLVRLPKRHAILAIVIDALDLAAHRDRVDLRQRASDSTGNFVLARLAVQQFLRKLIPAIRLPRRILGIERAAIRQIQRGCVARSQKSGAGNISNLADVAVLEIADVDRRRSRNVRAGKISANRNLAKVL